MNDLKILLIVLLLLVLPGITLASSAHEHGTDAQDTKPSSEGHHGMMHDGHGAKPSSDGHHGMTHDGHGSMAEDGSLPLGSQVSKGVNGEARIKDVSAAMAKLGTKVTHHFMMIFTDEKSGQTISAGQVALKVTNPDAKVSEAIELIGMGGHFGTDVILDMPGEYHFRLGTRLEDGTSRKYHFHYVNP